jgi:hypothetical protein
MKRTVFLSLVGFIVPVAIAAQEQAGELNFKSGTWSYEYYAGDQAIPYATFRNRLASHDKDLASRFNSGKNLSITGVVIGSIGAFCFGYDIGTRLAGVEGNTPLLVGGGIVMSTGIAMSYVGERRMRKVLTLYKRKDGVASLMIHSGYSGLGISFNF